MENPTQDNSTMDAGTADNNAAESLMSTIDSVSPGSEPETKPGNGENVNGDNAEGDNAPKEVQAPAWTQQLPEEMRNNKDVMAQLTKFAKIGDMAKSYSELESKLGKSLVQPGENASAEEVQAFYEKLIEVKPSMCGYGCIAVLMLAGKQLGAQEAKVIMYLTSGDATGDNREVVGYAAMEVV
mgnify:CR=1 FL=1